MCQITPFMLRTPVRSEIRNLHFLSRVRRMAPLLSRSPAQQDPEYEGVSSGPDDSQSYTTPVPPALVEITLPAFPVVSVGTPTAGCTLMALGSFAPVAKKIP